MRRNCSVWDSLRSQQWFLLFFVILVLCLRSVQCELTAVSVIGKPAWESSPLPDYPASSALDGDINSFAHTISGDPHPWWKVDLETKHCLGRITVALRRGCCGQYRFITAVARAGLSFNYAENQPCGLPATRAQSVNGAVSEFLCDPPRMARYVSLDIDASNPEVTAAMLMLAEVTVEEYTVEECPATQGPTDPSPDPENLITKASYFQLVGTGSLTGNTIPLSTTVTRSVNRCAGYCNRQAWCLSFNFAPRNGQCDIYNLNVTDIDVTPIGEFLIYVSLK